MMGKSEVGSAYYRRSGRIAIQVHRVVEQPQRSMVSCPAFLGYPKQDEVPAPAVGARDVQGKESLRDVEPLLDADGRGSIGQGFKCGGDSVFVSEACFSPNCSRVQLMMFESRPSRPALRRTVQNPSSTSSTSPLSACAAALSRSAFSGVLGSSVRRIELTESPCLDIGDAEARCFT